jgi:SAM-dependent methyltransferase
MDKHDRIRSYQERYGRDFEFEALLVRARQRIVRELIDRIEPRTVVEVGCGPELLFSRIGGVKSIRRWVIVEPAEAFASIAREFAASHPGLSVVHGFFEDSVDEVEALLAGPPDLILLSGVLHEVPEPDRLLLGARRLMCGSGRLHVIVPNALSLHRRLARAMGLISREDQLTERNLDLHQYRVFSPASLKALVQGCGFAVEEEGGYFLKPFTHRQMSSIREVITPEILEGLFALGRELPDLASEIHLTGRPRA